MFSHFFSFRGHIDRQSYFVRLLIMSVSGGLLTLFVTMSATLGFRYIGGTSTASVLIGLMAGIIGVIPMVWSSFALAAKRLRDIGLAPVITLPVLIVFSLFDAAFLTNFIQACSTAPFERNTPVGAMINTVFLLMLLLWPSRAEQEQSISLDYLASSAGGLQSSQQAVRGTFGLQTATRS